MTRMLSLLKNFLLMSCAIQLTTSTGLAHEFRIETEVCRGGDDQPVSESLTLFEGGLIYDFLVTGDDDESIAEQIAIFDTHQRKFVLLDSKRKVKTTIPEFRLIRLLSALKSEGVVQNDFLVNPEFEEIFDTSSGWLTLQSDQLIYRAKGKRPSDGTVLPIYHEFIDQFARLNVTDPRTMPPFARLKLNAAVKKYGFIPEEINVQLAISEDNVEHKIELTTKHFVFWELSKRDRDQIKLAKEYWMSFKEVTLKEFKNLESDVSLPDSDKN